MHIVNIENGVVSAEGDGTLTFRAGKIRVVLGDSQKIWKKELAILEVYLKMQGSFWKEPEKALQNRFLCQWQRLEQLQ